MVQNTQLKAHMDTTPEEAMLIDLLAQHTRENGQIMMRADMSVLMFDWMHTPYTYMRDIADAAGVSRSTFSHLTTQPVSMTTAKKIAQTMNVNVSDLFYLATPVEA